MKVGRVEWYSQKRGFGILSVHTSDGALDKFFVHVTKIIKSPEIIQFGQRAEFEVSDAPVRRAGDFPTAVNVVITEPQPEVETETGARVKIVSMTGGTE